MERKKHPPISYTLPGTDSSIVHNTKCILDRFTSPHMEWTDMEFELGSEPHQDGLQLIGPGRHLVSNCVFDREGKDPTAFDELASSIVGSEVLWYRCQFKHNGKAVLIGNGDQDEYDLNIGTRNIFVECEFDSISRRSVFSKIGQTIMISSRVKNWGAYFHGKSFGSRAGYAGQLMLIDTIFEQQDFWTCLTRGNALSDMFGHEIWPPHKAMFIPGWMRAGYADRYGHIYAYKCHTNHWWLYLQNRHGEMSATRYKELSAHLDSLLVK